MEGALNAAGVGFCRLVDAFTEAAGDDTEEVLIVDEVGDILSKPSLPKELFPSPLTYRLYTCT